MSQLAIANLILKRSLYLQKVGSFKKNIFLRTEEALDEREIVHSMSSLLALFQNPIMSFV